MWVAALLAVFAEFAKVAMGCKCTGVNKGVDLKKYGADYGTRCAAWEDGKTSTLNYASCTQLTDVGKWCCRAWCYVDPETCDGATTPFFSSFSQSDSSSSLFYSYAACDSVQGEGIRNYTLDSCPFDGPVDFAPDLRVFATVRDFNEGDAGTFGCSMCVDKPGFTEGLVEGQLDSDGMPVLSYLGQRKYPKGSQWSQWYRNGTKSSACLTFKMDPRRDIHYFDSAEYLPPGVGKGLFTTEIRVFFRYNGGEIFNFRGDDDVWVFVNGRLAMDLGGCHGAMPGTVKLDELAETLKIKPKRNYEMAIFHAERCFGLSNFMAEMTLRQDQGVCVNQCYNADGRGRCDIALGRCICYPGWSGIDCGTRTGAVDSSGVQDACVSGITRARPPPATNEAMHNVPALVLCAAFVLFWSP